MRDIRASPCQRVMLIFAISAAAAGAKADVDTDMIRHFRRRLRCACRHITLIADAMPARRCYDGAPFERALLMPPAAMP